MKTRHSFAFAAIALTVLMATSGAYAAKDSLKTIMKSWKPQNALAKDLISGTTPYDPAAAKGILQLYLAGQTDLSGRISPNSPEGKDMLARFDQFGTDLRAALANLQNRDTFKAAYAKVAANCGSCHDKYAN
jgi:cytochrome c556